MKTNRLHQPKVDDSDITIEEVRDALGDMAVGKTDAEVWAIAAPVQEFADLIVAVYAANLRRGVRLGPFPSVHAETVTAEPGSVPLKEVETGRC